MTRTTVNASTVLGANYEIITLEPNNYNPEIDDEITITCTVQDVYGDPVANKSVTLYQDGTSEGTETTDNTGAASWTITLTDWDVHHFNVANATLNINASGWKQVTVSTGNLWVNERTKLAIYTFTRTGTITSNISYANAIPSGYRPYNEVRMMGHSSANQVKVVIGVDGTVSLSGGTSSSSITIACQLTYAFGV